MFAIIDSKYTFCPALSADVSKIDKIISIDVYNQRQMNGVAELSKQIDLQEVFIFAQCPVDVPDGMLVFGSIQTCQEGKNITKLSALSQESNLISSVGRQYFSDLAIDPANAFDYSDYEDKIFKLSINKPAVVEFKRRMKIPILSMMKAMSIADMKYYLDNIDANILHLNCDVDFASLGPYRGNTVVINYSENRVVILDMIFANKNIKHVVITTGCHRVQYSNIEDCDLLSFYPHINELSVKIAENRANLANSRFKKMKPVMSDQN